MEVIFLDMSFLINYFKGEGGSNWDGYERKGEYNGTDRREKHEVNCKKGQTIKYYGHTFRKNTNNIVLGWWFLHLKTQLRLGFMSWLLCVYVQEIKALRLKLPKWSFQSNRVNTFHLPLQVTDDYFSIVGVPGGLVFWKVSQHVQRQWIDVWRT